MDRNSSITHLIMHDGTPQLPPPTLPLPSIPLEVYPITEPRRHATSNPAPPRRPQAQSRPSTLGIRRLTTAQRGPQILVQTPSNNDGANDEEGTGGRRRSTSAPQPVTTRLRGTTDVARRSNRISQMPSVNEEEATATVTSEVPGARPSWFTRRFPSASAASTLGLGYDATSRDFVNKGSQRPLSHEYNTNIVDLLDVVDPEVSTLSTLNNVQNSLFVPDLGRWLNRRPTYELTPREAGIPEEEEKTIGTTDKRASAKTLSDDALGLDHILSQRPNRTSQMSDLHSITSRLSDSHFAVLPHGLSLGDWSEHDKAELNDHVRHLLHSRREKFKRSMKGFRKYVSKPLGFFVTLYAFLITAFGLVWVLFLIGWISGGDRHKYFINVVDNVLVALFAVVGDGLAPFRCVDTYHMGFIAYYARLEWKLREIKNFPKLENSNDLPTETATKADLESGMRDKRELLVLNPVQQQRLAYHQAKFAKSHTFYKPHETTTHYAFSIRLLITIVALLDGHSAFQIALGACTWAISYHVRPQALTTVILCCSITCNITAGIVISIGDKRSRKKDVIERMFRQRLTEEALEKMKLSRGLEVQVVDHGPSNDTSLTEEEAKEAAEEMDVEEILGAREPSEMEAVEDTGVEHAAQRLSGIV